MSLLLYVTSLSTLLTFYTVLSSPRCHMLQITKYIVINIVGFYIETLIVISSAISYFTLVLI